MRVELTASTALCIHCYTLRVQCMYCVLTSLMLPVGHLSGSVSSGPSVRSMVTGVRGSHPVSNTLDYSNPDDGIWDPPSHPSPPPSTQPTKSSIILGPIVRFFGSCSRLLLRSIRPAAPGGIVRSVTATLSSPG